MNRLSDIHGEPIVMCDWYWAKNQRGDIAGVGKFLATIGTGDLLFWISEKGFHPNRFDFMKAVPPNFGDKQ